VLNFKYDPGVIDRRIKNTASRVNPLENKCKRPALLHKVALNQLYNRISFKTIIEALLLLLLLIIAAASQAQAVLNRSQKTLTLLYI